MNQTSSPNSSQIYSLKLTFVLTAVRRTVLSRQPKCANSSRCGNQKSNRLFSPLFLAQAIQINRMVMRQKEELLEENAQLRAQVRDRYRFENIIGDSPAMHDVFATVGQGRRYALNMTCTPLEQIPEFDCVVIVTDHTQYDFASIVKQAKLVVDTRNATKGIEAANILRC